MCNSQPGSGLGEKNRIGQLEDRVFDLENRLEAKTQEARDLANIASVITAILDIDSVLAAAMEIAVRQVAGEVGAILLAEDNAFDARVSWGVDGSVLRTLTYKDGQDIAEYCLKSKKTIVENDCGDMFSGPASILNFIAAPIVTKNEAIGVVVIINKADGADFSDRDVGNLEIICKFTSIAIENAYLFRESLDKQKMEQELELARQVQATFLPDDIHMPGLSVAASYHPARQVGGDYYDLIPLSDRKLFFLIGDVTSKGAPAALVMTAVYSIVRAYVTGGRDIDVTAIISHLNDFLCNDIIKDREMFITLFMAYVDLDTGRMEYCNGGHLPPLF